MKYQLHKDLVTDVDGNGLHARNPSTGVSMHILQLDGGVSLDIVKGQRWPRMEGWLAVGENAWPAPAAIYTRSAIVPTGFETLFYPLPEGEEAAIRTERRDPITDIHIERNQEVICDRLVLSSCSTEDLSFEGKLAWIRSSNHGLLSLAILEGRAAHLKEGALDIVLNRNATLWITGRESGAYRVYSDLMNYPELHVELNGTRYDLDPGRSIEL
jgi:hypothetical protein